MGPGTLILTNNNTYAGGTTITGGTLQIGNGGTLGGITSSFIVNNGKLVFFNNLQTVVDGAISGEGSLTESGTGLLILNGNNSYKGGTTIDTGASLRIAGSIAGAITNNGTLSFNPSAPVTYSGVISGSGSLTQFGPGNLTLTGNNDYKGNTTIEGGTLQIGNGGTTGSIGSGNITDNGTLAFNRSDTVTEGRVISGSGSLTQSGPGALILTGNNTFSGNIVNNTTLEFALSANAGSAKITNNKNLTFRDSGNAGSANITNSGLLNFYDSAAGGTATITNSNNLAFNDRSVAQSAIITNNSDGNLTFNNFSSAGSAKITNSGSLSFNNGGNSGNATITNNGGSVGFNNEVGLPGSSATSARITNNNGVITFSNNSSAGSAQITNNAKVTFSDNSSAANATITAGSGGVTNFKDFADGASVTLIANGTGIVDFTGLQSDGTTVGKMEGTGTFDTGSKKITPKLLSPGSSIGTLNVDGNLTLAPSSTYFVEFSGASDQTKVTGTAALNGSVSLDFLPKGTYLKEYSILHADGGFGGTVFSNIVQAPNFVATLTYAPNDVFLDLTPALGLAGTLAGNAATVANSINGNFLNNGTLPGGFTGLYDLTGANLGNALSQLSGEAATGAQRAGFQMTTAFLGLMLDPFVDGRIGTGGSASNSFASEQASSPPDSALAYASVLKAPPKPAAFNQRWTAWGSGFGGYNKTNGDTVVGSNDVAVRVYGFAGGMDYRVSPDSVVGFAFAGGGTNWSLAQGLGGGRSDAFQAGLYGTTHFGPVYVAAALSFANHWMSTDRYGVGDHLTASFNAQSYGGRIEAGYRYAMPVVAVTPYAALQAQSFHTPGYSETDVGAGSFGLTYSSRSSSDTRSELGARFDHLTMLNAMPLLLRARVAWAHDWVSDPSLTATFQTLPGANFIVNGATPAQNSALASAGAELRVTPRLSVLTKFDGEFANGSQTYAGTGTLRYTW